MLIDGIAGRSHSTLNLGDPIPLDNVGKVREAARRGWVARSPEGQLRVVSDVSVEGNIELLNGAPAHYRGKVNVKYWTLRFSDDLLFAPKEVVVDVLCADSKDNMGLPDIKVVDLQLI